MAAITPLHEGTFLMMEQERSLDVQVEQLTGKRDREAKVEKQACMAFIVIGALCGFITLLEKEQLTIALPFGIMILASSMLATNYALKALNITNIYNEKIRLITSSAGEV